MNDFLKNVDRCRFRALEYLESCMIRESGKVYWRHSPVHDPVKNPGHLLYGTWSGAMIAALLRAECLREPEFKAEIGRALNGFQQETGIFLMTGIPDSARKGHDEEYFAFHCTNYALGALRVLGLQPRYEMKFLEAFAGADQLRSWLEKRNLRRPWTEGNNIVNIASFYAMCSGAGNGWASERLRQLVAWHEEHQNPETGLWHADRADSREALENALAGAAHNLHLFYFLEMEVPRYRQIIDSCLRLGYLGIQQACVDIDMVDIFVHLRRQNYRREEIDGILRRYLIELLQVQNTDGGFADNYVTPEVTYGVATPAGLSITWTTWFRLATIGMIACAFFPEERDKWVFRNTLGMGYCNLRYAINKAGDEAVRAWLSDSPQRDEHMLRTLRTLRFFRQGLTWKARQWVRRA